MKPFQVSGVHFRPGTSIDERGGLLGWSSFLLNDAIRVNSVAVRRTRAGVITLAFPSRRDRNGTERAIVAPIDHASHRAIECDVLAELRKQGALP